MDKNIVYVAVLSTLCVLAGVAVGAGIATKTGMPCRERPSFSDRAEHFMRQRHGEERGKHFGKRGGEGILKMLTTRLELTSDQQTKVKEVLEKTRQEIDVVGKNVRKAMTEIKEHGDNKIMEILTPEQQQKFKDILDGFKKKRGTKGPGEECPPPPQE